MIDILIDAGTGVTDLSITELAMIDHVFITHTHLDHIAALPLLSIPLLIGAANHFGSVYDRGGDYHPA